MRNCSLSKDTESHGDFFLRIFFCLKCPSVLFDSLAPARLALLVLQQVTELVDNAVTMMGSELYEDAHLIYSLTKTKVQADGLSSTSAILSKRFAGQCRRSADKTEDKAPLMQ
jgi:hypothetical protein